MNCVNIIAFYCHHFHTKKCQIKKTYSFEKKIMIFNDISRNKNLNSLIYQHGKEWFKQINTLQYGNAISLKLNRKIQLKVNATNVEDYNLNLYLSKYCCQWVFLRKTKSFVQGRWKRVVTGSNNALIDALYDENCGRVECKNRVKIKCRRYLR